MSANDDGPCRDCGFTRGDRQVLLSTLAEYEGDYEAMRMRLADAEEELATAVADNAGLLRDASRLDWLESHEMTMRVDYDGACRPPWSVYYEQAAGLHDTLRGEGDTLREAIDDAMRKVGGRE